MNNRMSAAEYRDMLATPPKKRAKYGNEKVIVDGIKFDSKKEARRYAELCILQSAVHITNLKRQEVFVLASSVCLNGRMKPALRYISDFSYMENGKLVVEDVKSVITRKKEAYRIKAHLMMSVHGIAIKEV